VLEETSQAKEVLLNSRASERSINETQEKIEAEAKN
jgi:hypothetical protein